jgi:MFS family permease
VAFIFIFQFFLSFLLDVAGFVNINEVFPTHLRAQGVAIGQATNAVTNIVWLQVAPILFDHIDWKLCLFFFIITAIGNVFLFCPVTKDKALGDIAGMFVDEQSTTAISTSIMGNLKLL